MIAALAIASDIFTPIASVVVSVIVALVGMMRYTRDIKTSLAEDVATIVAARAASADGAKMPQPFAVQMHREFATAEGLSRHVQKNERDFADTSARIESLRVEIQKAAHEREVRAQQRMDAVIEKLGTVTGAVEQIGEHVTELQRQLTETLRNLPSRRA